jgi:hypothetical protein
VVTIVVIRMSSSPAGTPIIASPISTSTGQSGRVGETMSSGTTTASAITVSRGTSTRTIMFWCRGCFSRNSSPPLAVAVGTRGPVGIDVCPADGCSAGMGPPIPSYTRGMPDPDASTMRSLGRFFGRVRAGFLDGLRGGIRGDPDRRARPLARRAGARTTIPRTPRVVARRTTVVEEVHIIDEERR